MEQNLIITIGRQFGSGGREIGQLLAQHLNCKYYDKELIYEAAKLSGLCEECFKKVDEKRPNNFLSTISMSWHNASSHLSGNQGWSEEMIFKVQSDVIRNIAAKESAVIVGRCADYILRDNPHCISVFIHATAADCVQRIMSRNEGISEREAYEFTQKRNKMRAAYYNFYTDKIWGDSTSYDLCINSSKVGCEGAAQLIAEYIKRIQ